MKLLNILGKIILFILEVITLFVSVMLIISTFLLSSTFVLFNLTHIMIFAFITFIMGVFNAIITVYCFFEKDEKDENQK